MNTIGRVLMLLAVSLAAAAAEASGTYVQSVSFELSGSAPPVQKIYACGRGLQGRAYEPQVAEKCLDDMLASKFFREGEIIKQNASKDSLDITFRLTSPDVLIKALEFRLGDKDRIALQQWLSADERGLRLGAAYSRESEAATFYSIQQFFRSQGRTVLTRTILRLDYKALVADVDYQFVEGPKGPVQTVLGTHSEECAQRIENFDLTGVDDNVPIALIDQVAQLREFACFDAQALDSDRERLLSTGMLTDVKYSTEQQENGWTVKLDAKGSPLRIGRIDIYAYGSSIKVPTSEQALLPLKTGQLYRNSANNDMTQALEHLFRDKGWSKVIVKSSIDFDKRKPMEVDLTFAVLLGKEDEVYLNNMLF